MLRTISRSLSVSPALALGTVALAGAAAAPLAEGLFFQPKAETVVERTTVWSASMETVEVAMLENGDPSQNAPAVASTVQSELSVSTVDKHVRSATNRQLEFIRTFEDITLELEGELSLGDAGGGFPLGGEGESELDQIGVRFVYDEEDEDWERTFAEDYEGNEALLEPLRADAEYIALLPEDAEDVDVGDSWEIDLDTLDEILLPGGGLSLEVETELDALEGVLDPMLLPGPFALLAGDRNGDVTAKLESIKDGVATIEVEMELDVTSDQTDVIDALLGDALPEGAAAEIAKADYAMKLEGKGTLLWDLEAYVARSFNFEAEVDVDLSIGVEVDMGGDVGLFELVEKRSGEISVAMDSGE